MNTQPQEWTEEDQDRQQHRQDMIRAELARQEEHWVEQHRAKMGELHEQLQGAKQLVAQIEEEIQDLEDTPIPIFSTEWDYL